MNPRTTVNGLAVALVATGLALLSACGSDRTPISELPTLTAPEPTSTPRPVATRPPTATPTPVPPTPTSEATATPVPATPTPTREVVADLPILIVEGTFDWPGSAVALTAEEQDALNLGVSFFNLAFGLTGPEPDLFADDFDALRPRLSDGAIEVLEFQRDGTETTSVPPGAESSNRILRFEIEELENANHRVAICYNFLTIRPGLDEEPTTTVFVYTVEAPEGERILGSFDIQSVDVVLRDCDPEEMLP